MVIGKGGEEAGKNFKSGRNWDSANWVLKGSGHLQPAGAGWNEGKTLRYQNYEKLEGLKLNDSVSFAYDVSHGHNREPSGTDEIDAYDDVNNESKQDDINRSSNRHLVDTTLNFSNWVAEDY